MKFIRIVALLLACVVVMGAQQSGLNLHFEVAVTPGAAIAVSKAKP